MNTIIVLVESFIRFIFTIDISKTHRHIKLTLFGFKFNILHKEYSNEKKQLKDYSNSTNIRDIPPATGSLRVIQMANYNLLKYFDSICKEYNITYWLDFGTLLGSVRHRGFIPWDDDIDVGMMRKDYEKFIELFSNGFEKYPEFEIVYENNHRDMCFIKLKCKQSENICIDIFPYEKYHSKLDEKGKKELSDCITNIIKLKKKFKTINDIRTHFKTVTNEKILKNQQINTDTPAIFMGIDFPHKWDNKVYDWNTIFPLRTTVFEGSEFPAPQNPEIVLKSIYGDFMTFPEDTYPEHTAYLLLDADERKFLEEFANETSNNVRNL